MGRILIDVVIGLLLFAFLWKTLGKVLICWLVPIRDVREPDVDPTNAAELKALKAVLIEKQSKLKNKGEIAQIQKQLHEVNEKLSKFA